MRDALVALHEKNAERQQTGKAWQIEEDVFILHEHMHGESTTARHAILPTLAPTRTADAIRRRLYDLRKQLPPLLAAFPASVTNPEGAPLPLRYDSWTPISKEHSLPSDAHVDWIKGVAKAPAA